MMHVREFEKGLVLPADGGLDMIRILRAAVQSGSVSIFHLAVVWALVACSFASAFAEESPRPSVLFIAIDDLNDWVGFLQGHPQVKTPHMDRLAQRGIVFANAHCAAPLCCPSRAALLSGQQPFRTGLH